MSHLAVETSWACSVTIAFEKIILVDFRFFEFSHSQGHLRLERARMLGPAFRVAHLIPAARPGVLPDTHFRSHGRKLMLVFEHRLVDLVADRVGSRFRQLARLLGRSGTIVRR
jgi:hypothetical protein